MRVMQGMFPTTCEKCQRQKIYRGASIARFTRITRKPDHARGSFRGFPGAGAKRRGLSLGFDARAVSTVGVTK